MKDLFTAHRTSILIVVGVMLALGALWWSLSEDPADETLLSAEGGEAAAPGSQEIVTTLLQLRTVSLSGTIFSDPTFASLRDFGSQIVPETVGRPNPFAPLSGGGARVATTTATTTQGKTPPVVQPRQR